MSSKPYDVVLIPEDSITQEAVKISKLCEPRGVLFTLDEKNLFSHISFYMLQLSDEGLEESLERLSAIAKETSAVNVVADHYNLENNYLDVEYVKTMEISLLQGRIIKELNPMRCGLRGKDKERLITIQGKERVNILRYGYRSVGDQFHPHLTFTRFKDDQTDIVSKLPPKTIFNGSFPTLGLFEMGDNGTCVHLTKSWPLAK